MLAVKATYDNGKIKWSQKPKLRGRHNLIIVFENIGESESINTTPNVAVISEKQSIRSTTTAMAPLPELRGYIPLGWKDAIYGE